MLNSVVLTRRQKIPLALRASTFVLGLTVGFLVSCVVLLMSGVPLNAIFSEFVYQVFFTSLGQSQTITTATPLILVGLGAAAAMKLRFWNIGIEGQLWFGAMASTWVAINDIGPENIRLPLMMLAAVLAGAFWIAIPVFFKLKYGVNEIIMTLLMTYIAFQLVQHLLFGAWQDPSTSFPVSAHFDEAEKLARLGWGNAYTGIWIALAAGFAMWFLVDRTRFGYYSNAVGLNIVTARSTGLPVTAVIVISVLLSGGLSGLAGAVITSGAEYRLTQFLAHGFTFSGIVIAFVARFNPLGIIVAGLIIGGIYTAGETLKVFYSLSEAVVVLIEGILLLSLLISDFFKTFEVRIRNLKGN